MRGEAKQSMLRAVRVCARRCRQAHDEVLCQRPAQHGADECSSGGPADAGAAATPCDAESRPSDVLCAVCVSRVSTTWITGWMCRMDACWSVERQELILIDV